ncbi:MAG: hypothetical protein MUP76_03310 [Acidimicrobiia bacterium]|nr:hypothetical protein [Acidimicrobiia bacterium]
MALRDTEPVTLAGAVTAAGTATVNVLALVLGWDGTIVAALNICIAAWVGAISLVVRDRVTPNVDVALTYKQVDQLNAHPPDGT